MQQLKEMMTQLINQQAASTSTGASTSTAAIEQAAVGNTLDAANESSKVSQFNTSTRQASVKEIAKTLPEFDPSDTNAISVEQFIDRVDKFLLLAIFSLLKGPAKMWFDLSPVLHTSWRAFANALRDEFGTTPNDAEIHYAMTNAFKRAKETVTEYCFQDDEVKSQDQSRDAEIMMVMPSDKPGDESSAVLQDVPTLATGNSRPAPLLLTYPYRWISLLKLLLRADEVRDYVMPNRLPIFSSNLSLLMNTLDWDIPFYSEEF
ncbi:hypothetical protein ACLKA6_013304 [Drosophila palustris]